MMAEVAPDVQWTEMDGFPCAGTHVGPAQVIEKVFKVLGREWEGYRFELETLIDAGDCIVGVGTCRGTYRSTGNAINARLAHVWRVDRGLVRKFGPFTDTLRVAQAMRGGSARRTVPTPIAATHRAFGCGRSGRCGRRSRVRSERAQVQVPQQIGPQCHLPRRGARAVGHRLACRSLQAAPAITDKHRRDHQMQPIERTAREEA